MGSLLQAPKELRELVTHLVSRRPHLIGVVNEGEDDFCPERCVEVSELLVIKLLVVVHCDLGADSKTTYFILLEKLMWHL